MQDVASINLRNSDSTTFELQRHYVIRLDGPLTPQRSARLAAAGIQLGAYVPKNRYVVSGRTLRQGNISSLEFVDWVGEYLPEWKLDPEVGAKVAPYQTSARQELEQAGGVKLVLTLFADADVEALRSAIQSQGVQVLGEYRYVDQVLLDVQSRPEHLGDLIARPEIQYIEDAPETTLRNVSTRWIVQSNQTGVTPFYARGLHGENQIIGIIDSAVDSNHCSFRDDTNPIGSFHRKIEAYNVAPDSRDHGTHVAGIAVGDAGDDSDTRGVAYAGRLVFNTQPVWQESAIYNHLTLHHGQGARVHTNSWGDDTTTAYNTLCRGFDLFAYENEEDLICIAVTNLSTVRNPENAKNILAVGACQDAPNQDAHCSGGGGPTTDGRRKPEIFAPGCLILSAQWSTPCSTIAFSGSSMASPAVAGVAMLIRQYFMEGYYPTGEATIGNELTPSGALLKAMLLNATADMTGISGWPSLREGWGRLVAESAAYFAGDARKLNVQDVRNANGLSTGQVHEQFIDVGANSAEPLRVTLVWTDPPAVAGASFAAVNNLDLEVLSPLGELFFGNVFKNGQSAKGGARDDRNNVEQVSVVHPPAGTWVVRVKGTAVNQGTQGFALVMTGDVSTANPPFTITLPSGVPQSLTPGTPMSFNVRITPGTEQIVPDSPTLHYRFDGGVFLTAPLAPISDDLYSAELPGATCAGQPQYYVSALGDGSTVRTLPPAAPAAVLTTPVGEFVTLLSDNFETDQGWTVTSDPTLVFGYWERAIPAGGGDRGDPLTDMDGSGTCYVTDNQDGDSDIDDGATYLTSPLIDLSGGDAPLEFGLWYTNNFGSSPNADTLLVRLSDDDGQSWVTALTIGPESPSGWNEHSVTVGAFVTPTALVRAQFVASDFGPGSVVEAAVDAVRVRRFECHNPLIPGDMNCDGLLTVGDIPGFVLALTDAEAYETAFPDCDINLADVNADMQISVSDIGPFVTLLTGGG